MTDSITNKDLFDFDYETGEDSSLDRYALISLFNEILERLNVLEKHVTLQ